MLYFTTHLLHPEFIKMAPEQPLSDIGTYELFCILTNGLRVAGVDLLIRRLRPKVQCVVGDEYWNEEGQV